MRAAVRCLFWLSLVVVLAGCGASERKARCGSDARGKAEEVWNPDQRSGISMASKVLDGTLNAQEAEHVATSLDEFTNRWLAIHASVCESYLNKRALSSDEFDLRIDCIERTLELERAVIASLRAGERAATTKAEDLSAAFDKCTPAAMAAKTAPLE